MSKKHRQSITGKLLALPKVSVIVVGNLIRIYFSSLRILIKRMQRIKEREGERHVSSRMSWHNLLEHQNIAQMRIC